MDAYLPCSTFPPTVCPYWRRHGQHRRPGQPQRRPAPRPRATAEAIDAEGWFTTGDIARIDDDGYLFIVDRKKELIIRGGFNIYPREIEEVLYEHPDVREAAVIGIARPELGEEVAAAVALRSGAQSTPEGLRDYVKQRVAAYKYPRRVWLVDELPKGTDRQDRQARGQAAALTGAASVFVLLAGRSRGWLRNQPRARPMAR